MNFVTRLFKKRVKNEGKSVVMEYAFTGASGHKYYYFPEAQYHLNTRRYLDLFLPLQQEYLMRITTNDIALFIEEAEKMTKVSQFTAAIQALKLRLNITLDPMIIYQMMAVVYLREDEPNTMPSKTFVQEKALDIQNTMGEDGGDTDFFQDKHLKMFLNSLNLSDVSWTALSLHMDRQSEMFERVIKEIRARIQS